MPRGIAAEPNTCRKSYRDWALPGGYANLLNDQTARRIWPAFGANAQRVLQLKRRFDPDNPFPQYLCRADDRQHARAHARREQHRIAGCFIGTGPRLDAPLLEETTAFARAMDLIS